MNTQSEINAANRIVRIALAYSDAQGVTSGHESPAASGRQWQACCGVAARFLADPAAMTPALCHHEWRLNQMQSSHPAFWLPAVSASWEDLPATGRMTTGMGLRAMRDELLRLESEEEERTIVHLHADAQQMQDEALNAALEQMLKDGGNSA